MQTVNSEYRSALSAQAQSWFDDVNLQRVLGASTHIRLIGDMFLDLAAHAESAGTTLQNVRGLAQHFMDTRGESSQAISNAISLMLQDLDGETALEVSERIVAGVTRYRQQAAQDLQKIRQLLWRVLEGKKRLLLFDYSSTVAAIAELGKEHGVSFQCVIPESRALDGGRPYVRIFREVGHEVHFIPDSALYRYLPGCDAALIGAETFYPDGTCFNTIGSELTAHLCQHFGVPFYVPTPLIKCDMRALEGHRKRPILDDQKTRLAAGWDSTETQGVDFICDELVAIVPQSITAYITEAGILPPWAIYSASIAYHKRLMEAKV